MPSNFRAGFLWQYIGFMNSFTLIFDRLTQPNVRTLVGYQKYTITISFCMSRHTLASTNFQELVVGLKRVSSRILHLSKKKQCLCSRVLVFANRERWSSQKVTRDAWQMNHWDMVQPDFRWSTKSRIRSRRSEKVDQVETVRARSCSPDSEDRQAYFMFGDFLPNGSLIPRTFTRSIGCC